MHAFVRPAPLARNDIVAVVAPAGSVSPERLLPGLQLLQEAGLQVRWDPALLQRTRYFAGSQARRTEELLSALRDPQVRAIWAARGGYGTAHLLAAIDSAQVRAAGKWLVGFSDLTGLHARWQAAGLLSLHGANVTTLAQWSPAARDAQFALLGLHPAYPPPQLGPELESAQTFTAEVAYAPPDRPRGPHVGRLWGGNLTVLASLVGTGHLPTADQLQGPSILLLEEIGEAPYRLDRCWHQLVASGATAGVAAVVIGQLTRCEAKGADYSALQMLGDAIVATGLPYLAGLPFGHADDARAVVLGAQATVDVAAQTLTVHP
jgi:muramoyltetrapeptide carboxypeptidase